ncbi:MAG: GatB/YqeY domain-containing protein [Alteromonadaceae bacterium]|nr:GatB/YqeY domain-containing protein [Alteromonadaceae bacterium]
MALLDELKNAQKDAMRAKDKLRLGTIRMALAAVKQREVDERIELNDTDVLQIITKMVKQRKDASQQFRDAGRDDLADNEDAEIVILQDFLPQALSEAEINAMIVEAISQTGANGMADMGKVMGVLRPKMQGRADLGQVSGLIKAQLG